MKHTRKPLFIAACTLVLLLTVAIMLPIFANTTPTSYLVGASSTNPEIFDFEDLTVGTAGSAIKTYLNGSQTAPSTAVIAADPTNSANKVVQITSGVGVGENVTTTKDFVVYSGSAYDITWTDDETGTCTKGDVKKLDETHVSVGGSGSYLFSNSGAIREAVTGSVNNQSTYNVDRNLVVGHAALSGKKVVMQASYYVPEDAKWTFQSQVTDYTYYTSADPATDETASSGRYLDFYQINMTDGTIKTQCFGDKSTTTAFAKNTWNTVSMIVDLTTGKLDFYVNNVLIQEGQIAVKIGNAYTNVYGLTFNEKCWQVAKLNKSTTGDLSVYAGKFYVDNILCHSYDESMVTTVAPEEGKQPLYYTLTNINGNATKLPYNTAYLNTQGVETEMTYLTADTTGLIAPVEGASIRLADLTGIRFATQLSTSKLEALLQLEKNGDVIDVEIGTIISPKDIVKAANGFTVEALTTAEMLKTYPATLIEIPATIGKYYTLNGVTLDEGYDKTFVGSIIDIHPGNLTREFSAVGYVKLTLIGGEEAYIYSYDYDANTIDNYSRSIAGVAKTIYDNKDHYFEIDPALKDYEAFIQSLSKGANTELGDLGSIILNAEYSYNALYFKNAEGISNRLSYDGNNGWRLQSVMATTQNPYNCFNNMGAAQSLAVYMGEAYTSPMKELTVTKEGNDLKITSDSTDTYVLISLTDSFNIRFMKGDTVMNNVSSITWDSTAEKLAISGNLIADEAIYGGGERFDAANKRGKTLTLYTYDAYDGDPKTDANGNTERVGTYTVIPLFTSSRGSGFFVNRYEPMVADFGKTTNDQWTVTLDNDLSDVYFYATGNITDPIKGYTDLSGHADLPEEWAQGTLICRYYPDFATLDGQIIYENLTDIDGWQNYIRSDTRVAPTEKDTFSEGTYLLTIDSSGKDVRKYVYRNGVFYRTTKKGNPAGAGVRAIVENLIKAGMKPDALVLEGLDYTKILGNTEAAIAERNNLIEVLEYLNGMGIKSLLYMGVAEPHTQAEGYKPEYQLQAKVTRTNSNGEIESETITSYIPKANSANPDTIGTSEQRYLDISNPEAVEWYIDTIWKDLIDLGVDGVKIDFCETMPNDETVLKTGTGTITVEYLWYDPTLMEGDNVHHAYSSYFISMFYQRMNELKAEQKIPESFVNLTRGGGIGSQRNPYMWAGDQVRCEANLRTQLLSVLNSGLSGLPFMTYDMAGYAYSNNGGYFSDSLLGSTEQAVMEAESKIYARAIQFTVFGNSIQTHGDVRHVYEMTEETQRIANTYTALHEDLMPYIRKLSQYACDTGIPMIRHLILQYQNDVNVHDIDDQFMLGDAVLLAPILSITDNTREVYLPEGEWIDLLTGERITVGAEGKTLTVTAELDQIPAYLNTASEDAEELIKVFNKSAWQSVNGYRYITITGYTGEDPYGTDFFGKLS